MFVTKTQYVQQLKDKERVQSPFLIQEKTLLEDKNGRSFLSLMVADRSGVIEGRVWEDPHGILDAIGEQTLAFIEGRVQLFQGRKQLVVQRARALRAEEVDLAELSDMSKVDTQNLLQKLDGFIASIQDPHYRFLAEALMQKDVRIREALKTFPAAKTIHHAYPGGLLAHIISICEILSFLHRHYNGQVDRDLLMLGAFLHDIGKVAEFSIERGVEYSNAGRLVGHLVMGVEWVDRIIQSKPDFPEMKALLVKHLIVSHHGSYEYGSPKLPQTLEALLVHEIDNLDSQFDAVSSYIKRDSSVGEWTQYHKNMNRYFMKTVSQEQEF